jgi:hypothetical protein
MNDFIAAVLVDTFLVNASNWLFRCSKESYSLDCSKANVLVKAFLIPSFVFFIGTCKSF